MKNNKKDDFDIERAATNFEESCETIHLNLTEKLDLLLEMYPGRNPVLNQLRIDVAKLKAATEMNEMRITFLENRFHD